MKQFVLPNHPILTKPSKKVFPSQINSKEIQNIISQMLKIASGEQKNKAKPVLVGLAAPQIGILKRIILVDVAADGKGKVGDLKVYINPEITWVSKQKREWYEGCYSTGKVCGIVSRPTSIKLQTLRFTPQGCKREFKKHSGYVARIFQHEIDHLNGKVFVDHITDPNKLHWVLKKEFPLYRNKQAWKNWPKKCSFEKWKNIKSPLLKKA